MWRLGRRWKEDVKNVVQKFKAKVLETRAKMD